MGVNVLNKRSLMTIGLWGTMLIHSSLSLAANKSAGTSGAQFLKIGAGARPAAMGNSFTGLSNDVNAVMFNPAGLSNISRAQLTATHAQWFEDVNYDFAAFAYPTDFGAFALSAATLKVEGVQKRDTSESLLGSVDALDAAYGLTYSRNLMPYLSLGGTARYVQQKIDTSRASVWAGDIGILKRFKTHPLMVGLTAKNMGSSIKFRNEADALPTTYTLGFSYRLFKERLVLTSDVKKPRDADVGWAVGTEYVQDFSDSVHMAFRLGYDSSNTDATDAHGLSFGAGFGLGRLDFDFAWVPFGELGNTFRYSALLRF